MQGVCRTRPLPERLTPVGDGVVALIGESDRATADQVVDVGLDETRLVGVVADVEAEPTQLRAQRLLLVGWRSLLLPNDPLDLRDLYGSERRSLLHRLTVPREVSNDYRGPPAPFAYMCQRLSRSWTPRTCRRRATPLSAAEAEAGASPQDWRTIHRPGARLLRVDVAQAIPRTCGDCGGMD